MSQENVEIVRRYFEEAPGGPAEQLSAWIAGFWDPDGDYYPPRKWPESRPCHGREEIARFLTEYRAPWDLRLVVKDARAIGDDRVLVHAQRRQRDAGAAWRWRATSTTPAGSGMEGSSGARIT
jgi:SnoaL-like domain